MYLQKRTNQVNNLKNEKSNFFALRFLLLSLCSSFSNACSELYLNEITFLSLIISLEMTAIVELSIIKANKHIQMNN